MILVVDARDVLAPSHEVAEATLALADDLARTRAEDGLKAMQIRAMAMHNAALAILGAEIGLDRTRKVLEVALAENGRLADRDRDLKVPRPLTRKARATS